MRMDQIAFYCADQEGEDKVKRSFGLIDKQWIVDTVTARSTIWGNREIEHKALLQFNYDLGIELEILRYIDDADNWHAPWISPEPFISHIGIHLDDGEEFPEMAGCKLVQETFTQSHTSEYLTTGQGAGRKYHYRIFQLGPRSFIKYIRRIHP